MRHSHRLFQQIRIVKPDAWRHLFTRLEFGLGSFPWRLRNLTLLHCEWEMRFSRLNRLTTFSRFIPTRLVADNDGSAFRRLLLQLSTAVAFRLRGFIIFDIHIFLCLSIIVKTTFFVFGKVLLLNMIAIFLRFSSTCANHYNMVKCALAHRELNSPIHYVEEIQASVDIAVVECLDLALFIEHLDP